MIQAKRLAHATLSTPDLEQQIDYWTQVMGLTLVDRQEGRCFLATPLGEEAIALELGSERSALRRIAFQVKPGSDLGELVAVLNQEGIQAEHRSDISPGVRKAIVFKDTQGTLVEVFTDYEFAPVSGPSLGITPIKFGHVAMRVKDPQKATKFYCDILGFRVSDWISDRFSFLRCGSDHHTINFARHDQEGLLHIAFELRDRNAVMDACQHLTDHKFPLVLGPTRHVVGHNIAAYHRSADDLRIEFMAELDTMPDEELGYWAPRPWHEEMPLRPKVWPDDTWRTQWGFGSFGTFPGYP
jgi:catechol 2,3-dioxygenase-like lactoylglutathione lyase family enzyme